MEKRIQQRITLQPFFKLNHLNLTAYPIGNLRNPGIGLKLFDVMLPLNGHEKFELKKEDNAVVGSTDEKKTAPSQEGFGASHKNDSLEISKTDKLKSEINNKQSVEKLGPVYLAMQKATVKTDKLKYIPKKSKNISKSVHKFTFM